MRVVSVRLVSVVLLLAPLARADGQSAAQNDAQAALARHRHTELLARERARADAARAALLAEQQVQAAAKLRVLEAQTGADARELARLEQQRAGADAELAQAQASLAKLLPVMQRLAVAPAATLLAAPLPPAQAVRGIAILQGIAAGIAAQAQSVQVRTQQVLRLLGQTQAAQARLAAAAAAQQAAEDALSQRIASAQSDEMAQADTAAREAALSLAAQHDLDRIMDQAAREASAPQNLPLRAGSGGAPVAGRVVQAYGASTLAGPAEGISYGAAPGARVVTPCAGTVLFAAPFQSYGRMVIVDCGGGNSVVLAGMHHLDVAAGERLARGQPVGAMLDYDAADPTRQPVLYVELRRGGTAVDPTTWLGAGGSG